jgi:hypothetical protein
MTTLCAVEDCTTPVKSKGWCGLHYTRWYRHGDPLVTLTPPRFPVCVVDGCEGPHSARGLCAMHYRRALRHGDPLVEKPKGRPARSVVCLAGDCARRVVSLGYCSLHYGRLLRHGDPNVVLVQTRSETPTYQRAHQYVKRERGKATEHRCVDCGGQAQEWSYDHSDPFPLVQSLYDSRSGRTRSVTYSADTSRFEARCRRCHVRFDIAHAARVRQ